LAAFIGEMRRALPSKVELHEVAAHINSTAFVAKALEVFDRWVEQGIIPAGRIGAGATA
jgi:uncharacterized protein (UPF0261 family)